MCVYVCVCEHFAVEKKKNMLGLWNIQALILLHNEEHTHADTRTHTHMHTDTRRHTHTHTSRHKHF